MSEQWREDDHPREEDGKFAPKGQGGATSNGKYIDKDSGKSYNKNDPKKKDKKLSVPEGGALRDRILADADGRMSVDEIVNDPVITKAQEEYKRNFQGDTSDIISRERDMIRLAAANEINSRGSISGKDEFNGAVKKGYRAEIVIGLPAGGKSSVIVDKVSKNTQSRVLDSDEVKKLLPEFGGGEGAGMVHKESADIILDGMIMPEYYKDGSLSGDNIVIPIVGKNPKHAQEYLKKLKEAGYEVHLSFNDVTPLNSVKRATTRYIETGRFLSPKYLADVGTKPQTTYELLKKQGGFDTYSRYDNNVKFGEPARKVERTDSKGNQINWEDWQ